MTYIMCPECGGARSCSILTPDGELVIQCSHCGDGSWVNPYPLTDDPTAGRTSSGSPTAQGDLYAPQ